MNSPSQAQADAQGQAFAALYAEQYPKVWGWLVQRTSSREAAEDLAQDVFLNAWRAWGRYDELGIGPTAWLHRIAVNRLKDWYRYQAYRAHVGSLDLPAVGSAAAWGEEIAAAGEDEQGICARLDALDVLKHANPARLRELVSVGHGYEQKEIARRLGVSGSTIRIRAFRFRAALTRWQDTQAKAGASA